MFRLPSLDDLRRLASLAVPITLVQVSLMALGVEDCMIVGRYSAVGLAGVAIGAIYFFTIISFGFGMIFGIEPLVSQAFGARDEPAIVRAFQRGLVIIFVLGTLSALSLVPAEFVLSHLAQPRAITQIAGPYLQVQASSTYAMLLFSLMRTTLQARGITRPILITILGANVINIVLSIVLVFGYWGFPRMGPVGSGIASAIARWFMAAMLLALAWRPMRPLFVWRPDSLSPVPLWHMVRIGLPVGAQITLEFGVWALVALIMGSLGPTAAAANQIVLNIASFTFMVPLGIGTAGSVLVGQAIGAGDPASARRFASAAFVTGVGFMACCGLAFILVPALFAHAYTNDAATIALAATLIPIAGVFEVFDGTQVVAIGLLRGTGDTRTPMIVNLIGYWFVGLPLSLWLGRGLGFGPRGLWWGLVSGLVVVATILVIRLRARMARVPERLRLEGEATPGARLEELC